MQQNLFAFQKQLRISGTLLGSRLVPLQRGGHTEEACQKNANSQKEKGKVCKKTKERKKKKRKENV